jgi:hypothetical protein
MAKDTTWVPARYDTGVVIGDDFTPRRFALRNKITQEQLIVDAAWLDVKNNAGVPVLSFAVGDGLTIDAGAVVWTMSAEVTAEMEQNRYHYELKASVSGVVRTYVEGEFYARL